MSIPKNAIKIFSGEIYDIYQWEQQLFDGTFKIFEGLGGKDISKILLIFDDGDLGIGIEEQPGKPPFFSLLGGIVDNGEDPIDSASRELLELSGFSCEEIISYKSITQTEGATRNFRYFLGRGINYIRQPNQTPGKKIEVIKVTIEELMQIMSGPYFGDKDFALDLFKEHFTGGISRVRAVLGLWEGIVKEEIELIEKKVLRTKRKSTKKLGTKLKTKTEKVKNIPKPKKKTIIKKKVIKTKKPVAKKKLVSKFKDTKKKPKKIENFKSFLDKMEKKIKKKQVEFEEPLF